MTAAAHRTPTRIRERTCLPARLRRELLDRRLPLRSRSARLGPRPSTTQGTFPARSTRISNGELSGPVTPATGRHPLPSPDAFAQTLGRWGFTPASEVVCYDQGSGAYRGAAVVDAARAWATQRCRCSTAASPPGGQRDCPWRRRRPRAPRRAWRRARFAGVVTHRGRCGRPRRRLDPPGRCARRGSLRRPNETIDPVAGHVPGAINHPFARNLGTDGRFLDARRAARSAGNRRWPGADPARARDDVRLRRHRLPQPAGAGAAGRRRCATLRRQLQRMDTRPGAAGGHGANDTGAAGR